MGKRESHKLYFILTNKKEYVINRILFCNNLVQIPSEQTIE